MTTMEQQIRRVLRAMKKGATPKDLAKRTSVRKSQKEEYRRTLSELQREHKVMEYKGRYFLPENLGLVPGEIVKVTGTFGFAKNLESGTEVFVPGRDLQGSLPGDKVLLKVSSSQGQLPEGKVFQVLEEAECLFSGVVVESEGRAAVQPDKLVRFPIALKEERGRSYLPGDKVLARVLRRGKRHSEHLAQVVEVYGSADSAAACSQAILGAAGIRLTFPEEVLEQARAIPREIHPKELAVRMDLRDQAILTIDGADSKDLDDAVSLKKTEEGWLLGVHIADVSYYIPYRSALDREALERGTSVYYADSVVPMLPVELSNGICSLNPGQDRLTFSALLTLDVEGRLTGYHFAKTVIRSRVKGVYSEVNRILDGTADSRLLEKYQGLAPMLVQMKQLADRMTRGRYARGAVDLESVESKIFIGADGRAEDVQPRERGASERIIEEFMLAANEAAATFALRKELPFVFRVHESPSPDRLEELAAVLERLGIPYRRSKGAVSTTQLRELLEQVRGSELAPIINTMVLRSMAKAKYAEHNVGHFGLALENYAHFTSPIRRYPDLTIHRILSGQVTGMRPDNIRKRYGEFVGHSALLSTQREIAAMTAERDCEDCYKAEYMQWYVGREFEGIISSVTSFGLYVRLDNTVEGMIHQRSFPEGDWSFDGHIAFTERVTGRRLRLGDTLRVVVTGTDISAGQIDFAFAGEAQGQSVL